MYLGINHWEYYEIYEYYDGNMTLLYVRTYILVFIDYEDPGLSTTFINKIECIRTAVKTVSY